MVFCEIAPHLLRSPANARRLLGALNRLEQGEGVELTPEIDLGVGGSPASDETDLRLALRPPCSISNTTAIFSTDLTYWVSTPASKDRV